MRMHTSSGDRRGVPAIVRAALGGLGRRFGSALAELHVTLRVPAEARMPSLDGATGWLNSEPLAPADIRGKVVLVQFWAYTCIEWLRTFPYISVWWERYRSNGLVVIGVHTPEYSFEHDVNNVRQAVNGLGIRYPIAIDNHYAIWDAFKNPYSPGLYVVDAKMRIRHHQFGDGGYELLEGVIRRLLSEAGARDIGPELGSLAAAGVDTATARTENPAPRGQGDDAREDAAARAHAGEGGR
jgi:AhpC/TSA family protein